MTAEDVAGAPYDGDRYERLTFTGDPSSAGHRILHRLLEAGESRTPRSRVLEVGANRGEHLPHVRHPWDEYVMLDLVDRRRGESPRDGTTFVVGDVHRLPFPDIAFDRVIVTFVLHHLSHPEAALRELRRVARPGGRISILLPTDPGLAYRAVRTLTSGRRARRLGLTAEARLSHAREHRNHFSSLLTMARDVFRDDDLEERRFPLPVRFWNCNLAVVLRVGRTRGH